MTTCVFSQETLLCLEHGGRYTGSPRCGQADKADKLDARIQRLKDKRDRMRPANSRKKD